MSKYNFFKKLIVCIVILSLLLTNGIGFLLPKKAQALGAGFEVLGTGGEIDFGDIDWGQEAINVLKAAIVACFSQRVFGEIEQNYLIVDFGEFTEESEEREIGEYNDALSLAIAQDYSDDPVEQEAIQEYVEDEILDPIKDNVIYGEPLSSDMLVEIENLMYPFGRDFYSSSLLLTSDDAFSVYLALSDKMSEEAEKAEEEAKLEYEEGAGHRAGRKKDPDKLYEIKIGDKTVEIPKSVVTVSAGQVKETLETVTKGWLQAENTGSVAYGTLAMLIEFFRSIPVIGGIISAIPSLIKDAMDSATCSIAGIIVDPLAEIYEEALGIVEGIDEPAKHAQGFGSQVNRIKVAMGPTCENAPACMVPQGEKYDYEGEPIGTGKATCSIKATPSSGHVPLDVTFTPSAEYHAYTEGGAYPNGAVICYWDFGDGEKTQVEGKVTDGKYELPDVDHHYGSLGNYTAKMRFAYPAQAYPEKTEIAECSVSIDVHTD